MPVLSLLSTAGQRTLAVQSRHLNSLQWWQQQQQKPEPRVIAAVGRCHMVVAVGGWPGSWNSSLLNLTFVSAIKDWTGRGVVGLLCSA